MQERDGDDVDVLKQGDEYNPTDVDGVSLEKSDVSTPTKSKSFNLDDKNKIIIIASIVVVVILAIIIILSVSFAKGPKEEEVPDFMAEYEQEILEPPFSYTQEEVEALRLAGYIGSEIENFQAQEIPADEKVKEAEEQRKAQYEEEIKPYLDSASDEFNFLKNNTWVGGKEFKVPDSSTEENWTYHEYKLNADYYKIPARGHQLYLKILLGNGSPAFVQVKPELYNDLDTTGNIVVSITYVNTGTNKIITSITPIDV